MSLFEKLFIFPLPEVQLFPHALLPLHVFEGRYRAMARDCLAGSRRIAVAALEPGFEGDYEGRPAVKKICGVGEIVAHHCHPDGKYDILLKGIGRVRIVEELPPTAPYRLVNAEELPDAYRPGADFAIARQSLIVLCDRLAAVLPTGGDTLRQLARQELDPAAAADVLAAALVTDPAARQILVETPDVATRMDRVAETIAAVLSRLSDSGRRGAMN